MRRNAAIGASLLVIIGLLAAVFSSITLCSPVGSTEQLHSSAGSLPNNWPPQVGAVWPDIELIDHTGRHFSVDEYRGRVVIIEPIGMNCGACQSFSGGNKAGHLDGVITKGRTKSFAEYFPEYTGGLSLSDPRFVFIQLLLYDMKMGPPTPHDAEIWARHFGGEMASNYLIAVPARDLRGPGSYNMIPGFQLLDRTLTLRFDATGHQPKHSTWGQLLPAVQSFLAANS